MGTSPAFSFYAKDFATGTATMSLAEVGAYVRLLIHQWEAGSVPSSPRERARLLGCTAAQEKAVWSVVAAKFVAVGNAYKNTRLEQERSKQIERRQKLSDNGSKGGRPPLKQTETNSLSPAEPEAKANGNQNESLTSAFTSSSSDSLEQIQNTHNAPERVNGHGRGANTPGSLPRDHRFHGHCSAKFRVCLSEATSAKLMGMWGGPPDETSPVVQEFIDGLEVLIGDGPKGDHLWLIQHFEAFMVTKGRTPVAAPAKPKPNGSGKSFNDELDEWARS